MAKKGSSRVDLLRTKLQLVCSQKEDLYGTIDEHVEKVTSSIKSTLDKEIPDMKTITEMSSELEKVLVFLLQLGTHVEGVPNTEPDSQTIMEDPSASTETRSSDRKEADTSRQNTARLNAIEEQLKQMETKYDNVMKQGDSMMEKIEKRMKKVETGGKVDVSRLDKVEAEVETLKNQFSESQQEVSKLPSLEKRVETLSRDYSSLKNQKEEMQRLQGRNDTLASKMDKLATKQELAEMKEEVKAMTKSIDALSTRTQRLQEAKDTLDARIGTLATKDDLAEVREEVTVMTGSIDALSTRTRTSESSVAEVKEKIDDVTRKVTEISTQISVIGGRIHKTAIGFTAYLNQRKLLQDDQIIPFDDVRCNEGNNYDPQTGLFTAPMDGFYVTSLTIRQLGEGKVKAFSCKFSLSNRELYTSYAYTAMNKTSCSNVGAVRLKAGDQLYIKAKTEGEKLEISSISSFSCFLIG